MIAEYNIPDKPPMNHHHKENMRLYPNKAGNDAKWIIIINNLKFINNLFKGKKRGKNNKNEVV